MDLDSGKVVIFKNDKEGNESRPDYRGELKTPGGEHLRISLWVNEAKSSGQKYFGGNVDAPRPNGNAGQTSTEDAAQAAAAAKAGDPDDIPFRVRHRIPSEHRMRGSFDPSL